MGSMMTAIILITWMVFCATVIAFDRFRLIDTLLARYGYARLLPEMIVFPSYEAARNAGFQGERHRQHRHLVAWWPGAGMRGLCGRAIQRVTISEDMACHRTPEGPLRALLWSRMWPFSDPMWIEL